MHIAQATLPPFDDSSNAYPTTNTYDNSIYQPANTAVREETVAEPFDISVDWSMPFYDVWVDFFRFALFLSFVFIGFTIYAMIRIKQIRRAENEHLDHQPPGLAMQMFLAQKTEGDSGAVHIAENETHESQVESPVGSVSAARWKKIEAHAQSANPNDWRQAIMEADILLDELVTMKGYQGDGLGEKLKTVDKSDWNTIDLAWEAHKVRNKIAHEGQSAELDEREVRRVMNLYQQVFEEFNFV